MAQQRPLEQALRFPLDRSSAKSEHRRIVTDFSIGNIKSIGELLKLKMTMATVMHDCVVKLLNHNDEESFECLCSMLTTMGKILDLEQAKPQMDQYFIHIKKILTEGKISSRIRFMLQDIIDLRLHNWVSRGPDQGQKSIDPSHKVAKIEEQEDPRKVQQQLLAKDTKRQPDPSEQKDQRVQREEPGNTVPMKKKG
ncbi:unnamed protein product [Pleuronectes platessa]|uniref:MIF4G domain-containing protein n=1 Tax=Pleuronectes platessa TaxID=8262 RepID=A0A9N7VT93_PLEPL|nr:unnamed protein product [Pleuronectes platessa]